MSVRGQVVNQTDVEVARQKGLIILTAGENVIRLLPPLTISREEIQQGIAILKEVFSQVDE